MGVAKSVARVRATDIAIVGMSCRFPGGCNSPQDYWKLLAAGSNAVSEIPADRWDHSRFKHPNKKATGRAYTFAAGTIGDIRGFDAAFFGISPREADAMDPHQRMLLELAWEALESGGQIPEHYEGRDCAVYVGISSTEYGSLQQGDPDSANAYMMLGTTLSIAANRISYQFDLRGPSMAIDTACSSSLVALNEALNAIWSGRSEMALVGGISLLVSPFPYIGFSKATMLSEYGLCRAFGSNPGGYVRGEGGGVIVVKPLSAALRDGDPIHAVIAGAGSNADGRTNGIALPSHETQSALIEQTLRKFDIDPAHIDFFEAHGTGTAVGDPAETRTISQAIASKRPPECGPLPVGSAKSNIGHLEPASGMAGLFKAVLAIRNRALPKTLHSEDLNPEIDFDGLNIRPVQELTPLNVEGRPIYAGLNSFGFGGANATVVLREHLEEKRSEEHVEAVPPLLLSAKSSSALQQMAERYGELLRNPEKRDFYDIAYTAAFRRARLKNRLIVEGENIDEIGSSLLAYARGDETSAVSGEAMSANGKVGFIFNGNGAQWAGMGRQAYAESEEFRQRLDEIDMLIREIAGWSLVDVLHAEDAGEKLQRTELAQPALLAIQLASVSCLASLGLKPDAVSGHSVGEVAAAHVSGAISLRQAVELIIARSDAQGRTRGQGRMAAAGISADQAREIAKASAGKIELAAINSSSSVTFAGDEEALIALGARMEAQKVFYRILDLDYAFHSHVLDPVHDYFLASVGEVDCADTRIPFYSTVKGREISGRELGASYWWDNVRQPVQFHEAIFTMVEDGIDILVEIGPHAILQPYLRQILREAGSECVPISSFTKSDSSASVVKRARDMAYCAGASIDFSAHFPHAGHCVELPRYPWQHEEHWIRATPEAEGTMFLSSDGPFIGYRPRGGLATWESQIDAELFPFLADHNVGGSIVFPAAGYVELALEAAEALYGGGGVEVEMLEIRRPLVFTRGQIMNVRFIYDEDDKAFRIETRKRMSDDRWSLNAVGRIAPAVFERKDAPSPKKASSASDLLDSETHYRIASGLGLDYGPAFRTVQNVAVSGNEAIVKLQVQNSGVDYPFVLHPSILDGCLQSLFSILFSQGVKETNAYLPYQVGRIKVFQPHADIVRCDARLKTRTAKSLVADFALYTEDGECAAEATGLRFLRADLQQGASAGARRFKFELLPLDHATAECKTPDAREIAEKLDFKERNAASNTRRGPDLDAIAEELFSTSKNGSSHNTANGHLQHSEKWREAFARYPAYLAELNVLMQRSLEAPGEKLDAELRSHLLDSSPSFAPARTLLKEAIAAIAGSWPSNRRLRILEIGTANSIVREIDSIGAKGTVDYTIVSEDAAQIESLGMEVENGDVRFFNLDFAGLLPEADQKKLGYFDIVLCPLMASSSGFTSMLRTNIRDVLAPGGVLLVSEPVPARWVSLAFGGGTNEEESPQAMSSDELKTILMEDGYPNIQSIHVGSATVIIADAPQPRDMRQIVGRAAIDAAGTGWLVVFNPSSEESACAEAVCAELNKSGAIAIEAHAGTIGEPDSDALMLDPDDEDQWVETYEAISATGIDLRGVVLVGGISSDARPGWSTLLAARAMSKVAFDPMPRLHIVTMNASSFRSTDQMNLVQAPLWGIGRVIANEVPKARTRMIDLMGPTEERVTLARALAASLLERDPEPEVVIGADGTFVPRLRIAESGGDSEAGALKLSFVSGRLGSLTWKPAQLPMPRADEIVVAPRAAGLNFRDVMYALGVLPEEALEAGFAGASLGMEASGVVAATGKDVTGFRAGDEVICFAPNCFDSHIVTPAKAVVHKPRQLDFEEAATIPTAFFTVQYALDYLARTRKGERVLVHGAAGGVGLAAIQVARHLGAEIFVTVGTTEKRRLMIKLGIPADRIFDSRSLHFADDIMRVTNGEGVDVVLNSLAGEAIYRNLGILRPFGRFLELGKRDFYENNRIGLKFFRNNLAYFGIDADQLMVERPELAQELFADLIKRFDEGIYTPLPYRAFDAGRISDAFRLMQKSGHTGKIIVRPPLAPVSSSREQQPDFKVRRDASVFVSGGLSGFGLATARWFAAKGAGGLVLAGRSGAASEEAKAAIAELESLGVKVIARACDVTNLESVSSLFDEAENAGVPVRGIVHAAAVFDDATLESLNQNQYQRVIEPKILGGLTLHNASLGREIDFFVFYSSITTAFGNPGQANYVAANSFLEALAQHRRAQGLPAQAIGWGAIGDAGYLARNAAIRDQLAAKLGADPLSTDSAMAFLEELLSGGQTNLYAGDINWQRLRSGLPTLQSRIYGEVTKKAGREEAAEGEDALARMQAMQPAEALDFVAGILAEEVGQVLRLAPEKIDRNKPVFDLGMDSLMALELKLSMEDRFRIDVPVMALSDGGSINKLAEQVVRQVRGGDAEEELLPGGVQTIISRHVNDDDIENLNRTDDTGSDSSDKTQFGS